MFRAEVIRKLLAGEWNVKRIAVALLCLGGKADLSFACVVRMETPACAWEYGGSAGYPEGVIAPGAPWAMTASRAREHCWGCYTPKAAA